MSSMPGARSLARASAAIDSLPLARIGTFPRSARFKRGGFPRYCASIPTIARSISMTAAAIAESDVRTSSLSAGTELDQLCINTIRTLAMDAVQQAKSGHPGTPMALAPLAYVIWQHFLRFDPEDPIWPNRDRFVLSNGHASMLLY